MILGDALNLLREIPAGTGSNVFSLACGFTPLHLKTLLAAEIWQLSHKKAELLSGLYGDLLGSLGTAGNSAADFIVCLIEWFDLDPRLGLRSLGGWSPALFPDILENCEKPNARF